MASVQAFSERELNKHRVRCRIPSSETLLIHSAKGLHGYFALSILNLEPYH